MNILLIGHAGFWNRGCEAIVRGTVLAIKSRNPESSRINLVSGSPDLDESIVISDAIDLSIVDPASLRGATKPSLGWFVQTLSRKIFHGNMCLSDYLLRETLKNNDVIISIGGDNFSDDYGSPRGFFDTLNLAKKYGKKVVIWGASIGPFSEDENEWIHLLKTYDLITVRENSSLKYLNDLGVVENVCKVSDPAFLMKSTAPSENILDEDRSYVGIGVSALLAGYISGGESYIEIFAQFCDFLSNQFGFDIVLVPHVIKEGSVSNDDLLACERVISKMSAETKYVLLPKHFDACEMKYCVSQCRYFIGARTHSTIASLSTGVPTISIGYSVKAYGINRDLLGDDRFVLPFEKLTFENLREMFSRLTNEEEKVRSQLIENVDKAKLDALKSGELLAKISN